MKIVFMNRGVSLEFSENVTSKSNKNERTLEGIGGFSKLEKMSLTLLATVNPEGKTYEATLHTYARISIGSNKVDVSVNSGLFKVDLYYQNKGSKLSSFRNIKLHERNR